MCIKNHKDFVRATNNWAEFEVKLNEKITWDSFYEFSPMTIIITPAQGPVVFENVIPIYIIKWWNVIRKCDLIFFCR